MRATHRRLASAAAALALSALPALALAEDNQFSEALRSRGLSGALPFAFMGGLLTALTPCVYPLIAITVSVFGARNVSRGRAVLLSTSFVHGIAAFFVPLGLFAAFTGRVSGALAGHPAVQLFEAALMFVMAANMFGFFEISLPASVQTRLAEVGGIGVKGAFAIGVATGPIAAPCATAGLVAILDHVANQRSMPQGALALYAYSLGLGLPFWLVGALSLGLPKPGVWMERIKSVFGLALVTIGLWYLRHLVPVLRDPPAAVPHARWFFAALIAAGLAVGAVHLSLKDGTPAERARKLLGLALSALGAVWMVSWSPTPASLSWRQDARAAVSQARAARRPVLMDFGAAWCTACEELKHQTFTDERVRREAARFTAVMVDATEPSPEIDALQREYRVRGLPTVILLDAEGREAARATEFVPPDRMLTMLRRVD
ncbi:MAG: cytochrome c biogenesis protein CcdA [Polyangiales bacterium]